MPHLYRSGATKTTGRKLLVISPAEAALGTINLIAGPNLTHSADVIHAESIPDVSSQGAPHIFSNLGVAIVTSTPTVQNAMTALDAEQRSHIVTIEDERYVYALTTSDYLRGFADAADTIAKGVGAASTSTAAVAEKIAPAAIDESQTTWGLQLTGVVSCSYTGKGVKIAILDTGFDKSQPDFASRVAGMNFISEIANQSNSTDDVVGHGTHVTGTAAGPTQPAPGVPRYGIASDALIYIVKVLDDSGRGADGSILAGIDWAISQGCAIVSMSLGGPSAPGEAFSQVYETVAQRALAQGTLIIAAAGNESSRSMGYIAPVSHPANCPSILAVAAVDKWLQVADFSSAGPEVNIAGSGVDVFSSWPTPRDHRVISGTSMATPHVAGIAALYVEAQAVTGDLLRKALMAGAKSLAFPATDVGRGLVQAPFGPPSPPQ